MVRRAWEYPWSSAKAHAENATNDDLLNMAYWKQISSAVDWKQTLRQHQSDEQIAAIRLNTHTGRPLADDTFISKLEKLVNKRLRPLPIGRPKKAKMKK